MTEGQIDLDFSPRPVLEVHAAFARLKAVLAEAPGDGWLTAKDLRGAGFSDRELRAIAELDFDADILSFPGSPGYKLWARANEGEIEQADRALIGQAKRMIARGLRYRRRRHGRLR